MSKVAVFWIEAHKGIGLGHLFESTVLAAALKSRGADVHFICDDYPPSKQVLESKSLDYSLIDKTNLEQVHSKVSELSVDIVLVNHRTVELGSLEVFSDDVVLGVIDQLGNKTIKCDVLFNRSLQEDWLRYDFVGTKPKCCFGADYALLNDDFTNSTGNNGAIASDPKQILITMGGVDRTGATLRIVQAFKNTPFIRKQVILGPGFPYDDDLKKILECLDDNSFVVDKAVPSLSPYIQNSTLAISAGGNSMYEFACLGVPSIVLWEDDHERVQGECFQERGVSVCLGNGLETPKSVIKDKTLELLSSSKVLAQMSKNSRELVDGRGAERSAQILLDAAE